MKKSNYGFNMISNWGFNLDSIDIDDALETVGWVEPRNPTIPALTKRSIEIIGYLYTAPMITILNFQSSNRHW